MHHHMVSIAAWTAPYGGLMGRVQPNLVWNIPHWVFKFPNNLPSQSLTLHFRSGSSRLHGHRWLQKRQR